MSKTMTLMEQYSQIKANHMDAILFFRLGDFYEMFLEDAKEASKILDLTLTNRQGEIMCGIPYHAAKPYITKLLRYGKKIAICEQIGMPDKSKGLVDREVIEVLSPGTNIDEDYLENKSNNYLFAACLISERLCMSWIDVSTAEFKAYSVSEKENNINRIFESEFFRIKPKEVLIQQSLMENPCARPITEVSKNIVTNTYPDWFFNIKTSAQKIKQKFGLLSLKGLGFEDNSCELAAASLLIDYIDANNKVSRVIEPPYHFHSEDFILIDDETQKSLEILEDMDGGNFSLFSTIDQCQSYLGSRLLKQWLQRPLRNIELIEKRLNCVSFLYKDQKFLTQLRQSLSKIRDLERIAAKIVQEKMHGKDLLAIKDSIILSLDILKVLKEKFAPELFLSDITDLDISISNELANKIELSINEDCPINIAEGLVIKSSYNKDLDELRDIKINSHSILEKYVESERQNSGNNGIRLKYNRIIGYFLEISSGKLDRVPSHFIKRQSVVGGERFYTKRLSELEMEINTATDKIFELEKFLFLEVCEFAKNAVKSIISIARKIATIDCLASFSYQATEKSYRRPNLSEEIKINIVEGRHPVVEANLSSSEFIPNSISLDSSLDAKKDFFALITAPNMAGKSTLLRQIAVITLLAHIGSFIPAQEATIGNVDKIFCRVGARDNLSRGESTFLYEMNEAARILNTATNKSLVIMDELGRGTSTIDGLAIAKAVCEKLQKIRCLTLFATHFHELINIKEEGIANYSLKVLEQDGQVTFLKKLERKPASASYGIYVARLAGMPKDVLDRAYQFYKDIQSQKDMSLREKSNLGEINIKNVTLEVEDLFTKVNPNDNVEKNKILDDIEGLNLDNMTPIQALEYLNNLKSILKSI